MRIYLIGYMGSGKSKTAELLSKIFKYGFLDTDHLVEEKLGNTISVIFNKHGQDYFREIEKKILRTTDKNDNVIISTGGGTPCYHKNMEWMNSNGITVYLEANAGLLFHRLASSRTGRPLIESLNDVELMEQIMSHLTMRIPFYKQAMITVNAASLNAKTLAEKIKAFHLK